MIRPRLVVMVKEPHPGRVKTRLGRDIGMVPAAWWFRHQVRGLLRRLEDPRWDLALAVSPDREGMLSRIWPPHLPRIPQGAGDLGDRMGRIMRNQPPGPVCIIGADIPDVRTSHIAQAFRALGRHQAVFGPATDGGYWLVGLKRVASPPATLFQDVRWSTQHALADSLRPFDPARVALVDCLADVDNSGDLPKASHAFRG